MGKQKGVKMKAYIFSTKSGRVGGNEGAQVIIAAEVETEARATLADEVYKVVKGILEYEIKERNKDIVDHIKTRNRIRKEYGTVVEYKKHYSGISPHILNMRWSDFESEDVLPERFESEIVPHEEIDKETEEELKGFHLETAKEIQKNKCIDWLDEYY